MMDALTTFTVTVVIVFVAIAVLKKVFIPKPVELPAKPRTRPTVDELQEFTLSDVAKGDGFDGRPAYLAVDGFVFDMSSHPSGLDFYCAPDAPYRVFIGRYGMQHSFGSAIAITMRNGLSVLLQRC